MQVREHIVLSTAGAALLCPWLGRSVLGLWAGGVLIDSDHYAWYCVTQRRLSPAGAVQMFNAAHAPQHPATRVLHSPKVLVAVLLLALRHPKLRTTATGMIVHVKLDQDHRRRRAKASQAALRRDGYTCRGCGQRGPGLEAHQRRRPRLLACVRADDLVSLCGPCHEAAHGYDARVGTWR